MAAGLTFGFDIPSKPFITLEYDYNPVSIQQTPHHAVNQLSDAARNRIAQQFNALSEVLRNRKGLDLDGYASDVVHAVSEKVNAVSGCLFLLGDDQKHLDVFGSYASGKHTETKTRLEVDEGPVGLAFQRQRTVVFDQLNDEDGTVGLGLSSIPARYLQMSPLVFNDQAYGVLELMFFAPPNAETRALIDRLTTALASNLQSQLSAYRTQRLLGQLQEREENLKAQNENLREAQQSMRIAQENADVGLWEMQLTKQEFHLSENTRQHLRVEQERVSLQAILAQLSEEQAQNLEKAVAAAVQENSHFRQEVIFDADAGISGSPQRFIVLSGDIMLDANHKPLKMVGATQDITQLRQKQLEAEQFYRDIETILNFSPVGMMVSRFEDGVIVHCNEVAAGLVGLPREEVPGRTTVSFYENPEDRKRLQETVARDKQVDNFRISLNTFSGKFNVKLSARIIQYRNRPHFLVTLLED